MKFGLLVAPGPQAAKTVQRAEALGFDSAFFLDSPVVFGDHTFRWPRRQCNRHGSCLQIILSPLPQFANQTLEAYGLRIMPRVAERSQHGGELRQSSI